MDHDRGVSQHMSLLKTSIEKETKKKKKPSKWTRVLEHRVGLP